MSGEHKDLSQDKVYLSNDHTSKVLFEDSGEVDQDLPILAYHQGGQSFMERALQEGYTREPQDLNCLVENVQWADDEV